MNLLLPVVAAVLQAASFTLDKVVLSIQRLSFQAYVSVSFPLVFLFTAVIFLFIQPTITADYFSPTLLALVLLATALTLVYNLFFYRALSADTLAEIQTLDILPTFPIILFTGLLFPDERNPSVLIAALIAAAAVIWSHWEKHHFVIARRTKSYLLWSLLAAPVGAAAAKIVLQTWDPLTLELVHTLLLAVVLGPLFRRFVQGPSRRAISLLLLTNLLTTLAWLLFFYSVQRSGVVYTLLIFLLQPLLVYLAAVFFLRERPRFKKTFAFIVVLAAIVFAQIA